MIKATLIRTEQTFYPKMTSTKTEKDIEAEDKDKLFAKFFRIYDNGLKYINEISYRFKDEALQQEYRVWIGDIKNYASNGGDMW